MIEFIDTHAHLYSTKYGTEQAAMLARAKEAGVSAIYLPNIDSKSIKPMLELEAQYPDYLHAMMGLHPSEVSDNYEAELAIMEAWWQTRDFLAVGEIGLDYYWSTEFVEAQHKAFARQLNWAKDRQKAVSIHSRGSKETPEDALEAVIEQLTNEQDGRLRGILHCFSGNLEQAKRLIDLGMCLGVGGTVTYKNSTLLEVYNSIPLDYLVLETDAPYLPPVPYRGQRNESAYLVPVAQKLAEIYNCSLEQVASTTTNTAKKVFLGGF